MGAVAPPHAQGAASGSGAGAAAAAAMVPASSGGNPPVAAIRGATRLSTDTIIRTGSSSGNVEFKLQNVVATVVVGSDLPLKDIASRSRFAEYNPKRFAAVIMRLRNPKTTALMFQSGKLVITGAKSEFLAWDAASKFHKILNRIGVHTTPQLQDFRIQNVVGVGDCRFPIRLEGLSFQHVEFCSYEPELFPGLIYRLRQPKVVLLIFVSGKVVITGAKTTTHLREAFEKMYPVLLQYRK